MHALKRGLRVAPSPLNPVKLELALLIVAGVLVWIVHGRVTSDPLYRLLILAGYGWAAMVWLVMRTRRVLAHYRPASSGEKTGGPRQGRGQG